MNNGKVTPAQTTYTLQQGNVTGGGMPMVQQVHVVPEKKRDVAGLIKTIVIILLSLIALTFIGLFVWMYMQYDEAKSDVDYKISLAVADAKDEQAREDAIKKQNEDKYPYRTFAGPADYGQLTFEYPKTWSVYVTDDALKGGSFNAYFNPIQVNAVGKDTINALRVDIENSRYEDIVEKYRKEVEGNKAKMTVESVTIGDGEGGTPTTANRYTGTIPSTELDGIVVIFKIRDKTAILQTDSMLFQEDFDNLLKTIRFNA